MTDNDIRLTLTRGKADAALAALSQLAADPVLTERMSNAERMGVATLMCILRMRRSEEDRAGR